VATSRWASVAARAAAVRCVSSIPITSSRSSTHERTWAVIRARWAGFDATNPWTLLVATRRPAARQPGGGWSPLLMAAAA
jgi:hypothetical protein